MDERTDRPCLPRDTCRDCGTSDGMDWWVATYRARSASHQTRCHSCYLAYCRAGHARLNPRRSTSGRCSWCGFIAEVRNPSGRCSPCQRSWKRSAGTITPHSTRVYVASCPDCNSAFTRRRPASGQTRCPSCSAGRMRDISRRKNNRRRGARTAGSRYTLADVAERAGRRCHICGKTVDMRRPGTHPMGPTVDHLVPISAGGPDSPSNVGLAHRTCNVRRGAGGTVQLILVAA